MTADASSGSSSGEVGGRSSPPWWMSIWAVWPVAAGGLFLPGHAGRPTSSGWRHRSPCSPGPGWPPGSRCCGTTGRCCGWIGVANWVAPIVGHHVSMALVRDWWAPSMPGDLLGLLASVVMTTIAIVAALVGRRRAVAAAHTIPVAALALLVVAAAGCGGDLSAGTDPSPTTPH